MRQALLFSMVLLIAVLAAGCSTVGKEFDSSKVGNIKKDVTTQSEIRQWFGLPFKEGRENGQINWTYQYDEYSPSGGGRSKELIILFDDEKIVRAYRYTSNIEKQ